MTPLSAEQRRWWFAHHLGGPAAVQHVARALHWAGPLDPVALALAVRDVVVRHEVLRSVLVDGDDGEPHQRPVPVHRMPVPVVPVRHGDLTAALLDETGRGFDLATEVPLRARLLRCAPAEHVLVLVIHRIAADESSLAPLTRDLLAAYSARAAGSPPHWDHDPVRYPDHVARQRRRADRQSTSDLRLMAEVGRPAAVVPCRLGPELMAAVRLLAIRHGTDVSTVLRGGLAVLLHLLGRGPDVAIGVPVDERRSALPAVGPYTRVGVSRVDLSGSPPFADLLDRLRHTAVDTPPPACHAMLAWRAAPEPDRSVAGVTVTPLPVPVAWTEFDLSITVSTTAGGAVSGDIRCPTDLFDGAAEGVAERYARVLGQVTADPGMRVGAVDVLTPAERRVLLGEVSASAVAAPRTVPELVRRQVVASPDAVAVVSAGQSLTYHELDAGADRLAAELVCAGARPESVVGLALPRTADLVVALLAVLKSGAAYLPIDPGYPSHRLRHLLADAAPDLILTDSATLADLPDQALGVSCRLVDAVDLRGPAPGDPPLRGPAPENLAYVMYTSGSTGTPKGVAVTHANVVNDVSHLARVTGLRPGSRMLAGTSINFDVSVFEVFAALGTGATVEVVRDVLVVAERGGWKGSVLHTVPSLFADVLDLTGDGIAVDTVVFAGESLPAALVRRVRAALPGTTVVNAYGQTESFYATTFTVPDGWTGSGGVPIGTPLGNMRAYVLGPSLAPVPPGVTGDLYVAGVIGRGYRGRPGLTAQRFLPDPFGRPGGRMYRTGDLARWTADGQLRHLGRGDTQVKVRGVRVEPAEIEAVLVGHPDVAHAVVTARPAAGCAGRRLVAYVVPAGSNDPVPRRLRRFVADRLPAAMIPSTFVVLDRLPLAANGKLDPSRLPEPDRPRHEQRSEREDRLAGLFAETLCRDRVAVDDDFFDLGGRSAQAVRLVRRIGAEFGVPLPLRAFLSTPTVAGVADFLG